jgi:hypothetical protein
MVQGDRNQGEGNNEITLKIPVLSILEDNVPMKQNPKGFMNTLE